TRVPLILTSKSNTPKPQPHDVALAAMEAMPTAPTTRHRPPSEPEIETVLELDASMQKKSPAMRNRPPTAPEIETVIEMEAEPADEDEVAALASEAETVRVNHTEDARVVETITDTSSQTLTVTVTEPSEPEIVIKRAPSEPVTSDESVTASGTINGPRAKRASEGWDD
ncbi:MAG: hypothetical protein H0V17_18445, partial [Deltaproteobacteria bacterium]|nr:hypothetical protein [Deltaproteobacteria bacterium]